MLPVYLLRFENKMPVIINCFCIMTNYKFFISVEFQKILLNQRLLCIACIIGIRNSYYWPFWLLINIILFSVFNFFCICILNFINLLIDLIILLFRLIFRLIFFFIKISILIINNYCVFTIFIKISAWLFTLPDIYNSIFSSCN